MDYLVLFPTVFVEQGNTKVLLYNVDSKKTLLISNELVVRDLKARKDNYLNVFHLSSDIFRVSEAKNVIQTIENECFGWIGSGAAPPIQPAPFLQINASKHSPTIVHQKEYDYFSLYELSICIKGELSSTFGTVLTSCSQKELNFNDFEYFFKNAYLMTNLKCINIYGDDFKRYVGLADFIRIIVNQSLKCNLIIHCRATDIPILCEKNIDIVNYCKFHATIDGNSSVDFISELFQTYPISTFVFPIRTREDVASYCRLLQVINIPIRPCPIVMKRNKSFIKEQLIIDDILHTKKTYKEILLNTRINLNYYGGMFISSSGDIYASLHEDSFGNIKNQNIEEATYDLQKNSKSWYLIRDNVSPCQDCVFRHLCPPISSYEFVYKTYNLCNIKNF